jgi:hypothetical protein
MADVTISGLSPITPASGLFLPASDASVTGKVTLAEVCGVMTANQIINALGYRPQPFLKYATANTQVQQTPGANWVDRTGLSASFNASYNQTVLASVYFSHAYESGVIDARVRFILNNVTPYGVIGANGGGFRVATQTTSNRGASSSYAFPVPVLSGQNTIGVQVVNWSSPTSTWTCVGGQIGSQAADALVLQYC